MSMLWILSGVLSGVVCLLVLIVMLVNAFVAAPVVMSVLSGAALLLTLRGLRNLGRRANAGLR